MDKHVALLPYLVLLRAGFTVPRAVTSRAVRSYRTFSPLPTTTNGDRRYIFCGTFHGLTPPRRYLAPCPKEPGLSSVANYSDCLANSGFLGRGVYTNTRSRGLLDKLVVKINNDNSLVNLRAP